MRGCTPGKQGPGRAKQVVLISGDEEYRSEEALAQLGKIPSNGTQVDLVGDCRPSAYRFHGNDYWRKRALKPAAFQTLD